mgnify:CR=1 FL=1
MITQSVLLVLTYFQSLEEIFRTPMNSKDLAKTEDFNAPDLYTVR